MPKSKFLYSRIIIFLTFSILITKFVIAADVTPPTTTYIQTPSSPNGNNGWYITPVNFALNAVDLDSGVKEIHYKVDGNNWQIVSFLDSLNLVTNPSFEIPGSTSTSMQGWEVSINDGQATHSRDTGEYLTGYEVSSARIIASAGPWHGINNKDVFAVATPLGNMSASLWMKTSNVVGNAYFLIYIVSQDPVGNITYTQVAQSNMVTGTVDWTKLSANFIVNDPNAIGVYIDFGLDGTGSVWADAVTISESQTTATTNVSVATDGTNHTLEFFSIDNANNSEAHSCPTINCVRGIKIDQTPPGNWHDSGAFRGLFGSDHELYVYTIVEDRTSGLSTFTDKYQYHTDKNPGFGKFSSILNCNSNWNPNGWVILISPPFIPGVKSAYLLTPKTDFCNNDWKTCKTVRFLSIDMAGNQATKDYCINGPWLKFRGEGIIRSNQNISMISEPEEDNADGLIELGGNSINFLTSSQGWILLNQQEPKIYTYQTFFDATDSKTNLGNTLVAGNGLFYKNGNFTINSSSIPSGYGSNTFNQVVWINGDLTITNDIGVHNNSTALFIVSGDVNISKSIENIKIGIFADGDVHTAYDLEEGEGTKTLNLNGIYSANKFMFKRTLQGTNNQNYPSENFVYEPKYLLQLKDIFGKNYMVWKSVQ